MMNINYNRLFNLRLFHNYYENNRARGIRIAPTRDTRRLLRGGRMLFKKIPFGMTVLYRATDDGVTPLVEFDSELKLSFSLKVEDKAHFFTVTDLDEPSSSKKYTSSNILYFRNDPAEASADPDSPEEITHALIDATRNSLFTYQLTLESGPAEVLLHVLNDEEQNVAVGKTADGSLRSTPLTLAKNDEGFYEQQIDLRDRAWGKYTFKVTETDSTPLHEEVIYVNDELAAQDLLGIVDINYKATPDHLYSHTEEYGLMFSRREAFWKYFIVNKNKRVDLDDENLVISVNEIGGSTANGYGSIGFTKDGPEPHDSIKVNGLETVVFKSNDVIPFKEISKAAIELIKEPDDTVLISNLPNPSHSSGLKEDNGASETQIYVFI